MLQMSNTLPFSLFTDVDSSGELFNEPTPSDGRSVRSSLLSVASAGL